MTVAILILALFAKFKNNNMTYLAPLLIIILNYFRLYTFDFDLTNGP